MGSLIRQFYILSRDGYMINDTKTFFMPHYGEFGWFLMHHIRVVHRHDAAYKIVACRKGEEIFFPSASEFYYDWEDIIPVNERCFLWSKVFYSDYMDKYNQFLQQISQQYENIAEQNLYKEYIGGKNYCEGFDFIPPFDIEQLNFDKQFDICLAPRNLNRNNDKNFDCGILIDAFLSHGFSVACVGLGDGHHFDGVIQAWDDDNPTEMSVKLLQNSKLYVGHDSGLANLAAFLSVPILLFNYVGLSDDEGYMWHMKKSTKAPFYDIDSYNVNQILDKVCWILENE